MARYRILEVQTGRGDLTYWVQSKQYWFTPWITKRSPKEFSSRKAALSCIAEMKRVVVENRKYNMHKRRKVVSYEEIQPGDK